MSPIRLSVAICTHNRSVALASCLAALGGPDADTEIIVIDSGSTSAEADSIATIARGHGAQHIRLAASGVSAARNAALAAASGNWIAYLDDDAIPAPDWRVVLHNAIARDPSLAATGGSILPRFRTSGLPAWWPPSLRGVLTIIDAGTTSNEPYAANIAFDRKILAAFGGFPTCLGRRGDCLLSNEETYIIRRFRRAGLTVRLTPDLVVHHEIASNRLKPDWLLRRQYWSGMSEAMMLRALGERCLPKALRMAIHVVLLAPMLLWPDASTHRIGNRCAAAFARGFVRGAMIENALTETIGGVP
ncbi:MAG TPA: glycosyltransferase [Acidiphilium sp.]